MMRITHRILLYGAVFITWTIVVFVPIISLVYAQNTTVLKNKIQQQKNAIDSVNKEIRKYQQQLTIIGQERHTLKNALSQLAIAKKNVDANISLAQYKINLTSSTLSELNTSIEVKTQKMRVDKRALAETLRHINEIDSQSFLEVILNSSTLTNVWDDVETSQRFQRIIRSNILSVTSRKKLLEAAALKKEKEQNILVNQRVELSVQQRSLLITQQAKNRLLHDTQNRESTYQKLLATKKKAKKEFEAQLHSFEQALQYIVDPSSIPKAGKGVLRWPLAHVLITQYFGNTSFAKTGAYNGEGHNGIDMATPIGTPVHSVLSGTIKATGNTDAYPGCYFYGKWVLIEHGNGLSTLYGHLSKIAVTPGEAVATGEVIAYSGNTGYSFGPHLHLTTFVTKAVNVIKFGDVRPTSKCARANIPVSSWSGYLNPLDYLK